VTDGDAAVAELDGLHAVTQRLMHAETEQEICDVAVAAVPEIFDVPFGGLWLYDAEARELQLTAETEQSEAVLDGHVVYRPGNSISWAAFESGEIRLYPDDAEPQQRYDEDSRISCELILPIGEYGVMNLGTEDTDAFSPMDLQVGKLLATAVESALSKAEREHALEIKNDRLEEFVGIVSHDLRNPLTVADGNLELARANSDSEYLSNTADAIDRMDTLIEELLTLAEQGYVVDTRTTLDLATLAQRAWSNVPTSDATLRTEGTASIFGDEQRLLQVFENLFRNSVEHASAGSRTESDDSTEHGSTETPDDGTPTGSEDGVTIRVGPLETVFTTTRGPTGDTSDGFYVADDGPGIPQSEQSSVFDSGHSTGGTGLGLAIVQRIVAAHGWDISVGDGFDGGARFEITSGAKSVTPFESD
jgi:signal transduction histidine kinase